MGIPGRSDRDTGLPVKAEADRATKRKSCFYFDKLNSDIVLTRAIYSNSENSLDPNRKCLRVYGLTYVLGAFGANLVGILRQKQYETKLDYEDIAPEYMRLQVQYKSKRCEKVKRRPSSSRNLIRRPAKCIAPFWFLQSFVRQQRVHSPVHYPRHKNVFRTFDVTILGINYSNDKIVRSDKDDVQS